MIRRVLQALLAVAVLELGAAAPVAARPIALPGASIPVSSRLSVDFHYIDLGKSFTYETGFGRLDVASAGSAAGVRARVSRSLDLGFTYLDFDVLFQG